MPFPINSISGRGKYETDSAGRHTFYALISDLLFIQILQLLTEIAF